MQEAPVYTEPHVDRHWLHSSSDTDGRVTYALDWWQASSTTRSRNRQNSKRKPISIGKIGPSRIEKETLSPALSSGTRYIQTPESLLVSSPELAHLRTVYLRYINALIIIIIIIIIIIVRGGMSGDSIRVSESNWQHSLI